MNCASRVMRTSESYLSVGMKLPGFMFQFATLLVGPLGSLQHFVHVKSDSGMKGREIGQNGLIEFGSQDVTYCLL